MTPHPEGRSAAAWWLGGIPVIAAPVLTILWLAITLTSDGGGLALAVAKIVFVIVAVITALCGIKWSTAAGLTLFIEAMIALIWVAVRSERYPPIGILRTTLMLIVPLAVSGVMLVLYGGFRAGTWPPARFRAQRENAGTQE